LITDDTQRWRKRRTSYRPAGEVINPREYEVVLGPGKSAEAKAFVVEHHYSGTYVAGKRSGLLYRRGQLVGVGAFSIPQRAEVLDNLPCDRAEALELGRLVLLDEVPGNAESWFGSRAMELLRREGFAGVVMFSDPVPRRRADGHMVMPGHRGIIYQALSATYTGRTKAETKWLLPDGTIFGRRTMSKARNGETGRGYAIEQLVAAGASPPGDDIVAWLTTELPRIARPFRHAGNHRYLIPLSRACRRALPAHLERRGMAALPYPRAVDPEPEVRCAA
jgi:hypothetical protein